MFITNKIKISFRGWDYLLDPVWYTTLRWHNPHTFADGQVVRILDCGCFCVCVYKNTESTKRGE